jgi:sialic acid synthase SpsE
MPLGFNSRSERTVSNPYIIAEAAQGYLPLEGSVGSADTALLLVRGAVAARADAVKFQIVYASELAQPGNPHYDTFLSLELSDSEWVRVAAFAREHGIDFVADVFGPQSLQVASACDVDGAKIHSTNFFDHHLVSEVLALGCPVYFSVGGIETEEILGFINSHGLQGRTGVTLLYGFQSEPTPTDMNNLLRIPRLRELTGIPVGFMDHADGGDGSGALVSLLALALGVRTFEKHLTLDRALEMEDYVSALPPGAFRDYVTSIREMTVALGSDDLELTELEQVYRNKSLKRVTVRRPVRAGSTIEWDDIRLIRGAKPVGVFDPTQVVGKVVVSDLEEGAAVKEEDVE